MALAKQKIVQALIQGIIEVADKVEEANDLAQNYKDLFQAHGVSLTDTNLTSAQVTAITTFVSDLNTLANGAVVTTVHSKDHPSHGTGALS